MFDKFVHYLLEYRFEFDCFIDEVSTEYCVHIILGNNEYVVSSDDDDAVASLWSEIRTFWNREDV